VRRLAYGTAACLAAFSLAVAGCGQDADSPAAAAEAKRPSKQEFIAAADRLCAEFGAEYDAAAANLPPYEQMLAPNVSRPVMLGVAAVAPRIATVERALERELRALDPPADFATRWDRALDTLEARAVAAEDVQAAAEAADRDAYLSAFQRFDREGTVSSEALAGYGFEVCAAG
jgi:hypothetical protein